MKKIITAHLNQSVFSFETDAYDQLQRYFESIRTHYAATDDASEIVFDIESRAAEIFKDTLGKNKKVITLSDIDAFIASMGTVAQLSNDETLEDGTSFAPTTSAKPFSLSKRLFRNMDTKIIAGVASGLANYFNLDPVIIRLIFLATFFIKEFHGFGLIFYIILWFVVPEAKTSADKLEMQGAPVNLNTIHDTVTSRLESDSVSESMPAKIIHAPFRLLGSFISFVGNIVKTIVPLTISATGFFIILGTALAIAGVIFTMVMVTFNLNSLLIHFPFPELMGNPLYYIGMIALTLIMLIPLMGVLQSGTSLLRRRPTFSWTAALVMFFVWVISGAVFIGVAFRLLPTYAPQIRNYFETNQPGLVYSVAPDSIDESNFQDIPVAPFTQINATAVNEVVIKQGSRPSVKIVGAPDQIERTHISVTGPTLVINGNNSRSQCLFCHVYGIPVRVELTVPALSSVSASGATQVTLEKVSQSDLVLNLSGAAHALLSGSLKTLTASLTGATRLNSLKLQTSTLKIKASGASITNAAVASTLDADLSGMAQLFYLGQPVIKSNTSGTSHLEEIDPELYDLATPTPTVTPSIIINKGLTPTSYAKKINPTPTR